MQCCSLLKSTHTVYTQIEATLIYHILASKTRVRGLCGSDINSQIYNETVKLVSTAAKQDKNLFRKTQERQVHSTKSHPGGNHQVQDYEKARP